MPTDFLTEEQRQAYGQYVGDPTPPQLARDFHFDSIDLTHIRACSGSHQRLGFAIQLATVRFLGTFLDDPLAVPDIVVVHVARQLPITTTATLPRYRDRPRTARDHAALIATLYGYTTFTDQPGHFRFLRWLYGRAWRGTDRAGILFDRAVAWLREHKILLPGITTLERTIADVSDQAGRRFWTVLTRSAPAPVLEHLERLLEVPQGQRLTTLERLRRPPTQIGVRGLQAALRRVADIESRHLHTLMVPAVPTSRLKPLVRHASLARTQSIARMTEARRRATLIAYAATLHPTALDETLDVFDQHLDQVFARAERRGQQRRIRTLKDLDAAALILEGACTTLLDPAHGDGDVRSAVLAQYSLQDLHNAIVKVRELAQPPQAPHADELKAHYTSLRRILTPLLQTITFDATPAGQHVIDALEFLVRLDQPQPPKLHHAPTDVVTGRWKPLVLDSNQVVDRPFYTLCVLEQLQAHLDRRDVFVPAADRWGDPRAKLMAPALWATERGRLTEDLGRSLDPAHELACLTTKLDDAYQEAMAALANDPTITLVESDGHDRPSLERLEKLDEPPSLLNLRRAVRHLMPQVDVTEMILEIHALTGFLDDFTHISESGARVEDLHLSLCAVLVAEACNLGLEALVDQTVPALRRERLAWVQQHYVRVETLALANARLVDFQRTIPLAQHWGGGEVASADGLRFVVPVRTIHAGPSHRYFPGGRGVTWYNGISDQHTGFAATVVAGALRDAPWLLNLLLDQQTSLRPREVMTDTAGYSDIIFALFFLLGYEFSPRLADFTSMRFWRIDPMADYGPLQDLSRHRINTRVIADFWDEMLRVAGSLSAKTVTADVLVRWLHGDKRPNGLARALTELGRICKTLYLLKYMTDPVYRRRILTQLNKGEHRHKLARVVFHGQRGELRQRYRIGQEDQLGALGLILNVVVLWNTRYMNAAINHLTVQGEVIRDADKARLAPFGHRHLNLIGRYLYAVPADIHQGALRPFRDPSDADDPLFDLEDLDGL